MGGVLMVPVNETLEGLGIAAPQYQPGRSAALVHP
jgi:hypothetical protein